MAQAEMELSEQTPLKYENNDTQNINASSVEVETSVAGSESAAISAEQNIQEKKRWFFIKKVISFKKLFL